MGDIFAEAVDHVFLPKDPAKETGSAQTAGEHRYYSSDLEQLTN
jgi:hypothetical protein